MNPEKINYNAFVDDTADINNKSNRNLKLDNRNSRFSKLEDGAKVPTKQEFEHKAIQVKQKHLDINARVAELSGQYRGLFQSKTLPENKTPHQKQLEKEIIFNLSQLCLDLDNDETQKEGIGSIGLCKILLSLLLEQKDNINILAYEVSKLKKALSDAQK